MTHQGDELLRVIIVDDEEPARRLLSELLGDIPAVSYTHLTLPTKRIV